jgi:hypothetical protein
MYTARALLFISLIASAGNTLYGEQMPSFTSIKSQLEDMRFYTKENYVRDHASEYISQINSSNLTQDEQAKLWNLFVRRLMTILLISDGYGKVDIISEGSKPSVLPSTLTYLSDLVLHQTNTSNLIAHPNAASLFQDNWAPLEPKIAKAKASGKKAFYISLVPLIIMSLLAANNDLKPFTDGIPSTVPESIVPMIAYAKACIGAVMLAAILGGLFYLFARLRIKLSSSNKKAVLTFEIIMKRLKAIMASDVYTTTMPINIKKQIAAALSDAEQHTLPSNEELKTEEGEKRLRARQLPLRNLFITLSTKKTGA